MASYTKQTIVGTQDGVNTIYTITDTNTKIEVYKNGLLLVEDGNDYTLSGTTVTFIIPPASDDILQIWVFIP